MSIDCRTRFQVLLVEDGPADANLPTMAISRGEILCAVHHAMDGFEALAFLRRRGEAYRNAPRPDLILLDLNIPRMDGREVLAALKNDPDLNTMPAVAVTATDLEPEVDICH